MRRSIQLLSILLLLGSANCLAWHTQGEVLCDTQPNGIFDEFDTPLAGVGVTVEFYSGGVLGSTVTGSNGAFFMSLPDYSETYEVTLVASTLPADASITIPATGSVIFVSGTPAENEVNFLIDSASCQEPPQDGCWMTGGGVKFEPIVGQDLAKHGPKDTLGGVVYPGCDSSPSDGGQWNHVAHTMKEHYQIFDISTVRCGNVDDHPPGSESPVTPFNFIEWEGTGRMKGIHGNKSEYDVVHFFGRAEDRNEPGSEGPADGGDIDRYFLHAWVTGPLGTTTTVFCVDQHGDCSTVDPTIISGGNLQLHYSSCE